MSVVIYGDNSITVKLITTNNWFYRHLGIRIPSKQAYGLRIPIQLCMGEKGGPNNYEIV